MRKNQPNLRKNWSGLRKRDRSVRNRPRKRPFWHHRAENNTSVPKNTTEIDRSQQRAQNTTSVPKNTPKGSIFCTFFRARPKYHLCSTKSTRYYYFFRVRRGWRQIGCINFKVLNIKSGKWHCDHTFLRSKKISDATSSWSLAPPCLLAPSVLPESTHGHHHYCHDPSKSTTM